MRSYFDTSALIPAMIQAHPHHEAAVARLNEVRAKREFGFMSAHGLTECYSILTRAPFQPPLHPADVWRILESQILKDLELVSLDAGEMVEVTRECAQGVVVGGRIHDAVHLRCALKAGCERIYTFNVKDFRGLAGAGRAALIVMPS